MYSRLVTLDGQENFFRSFPSTLNNQLRTGTDDAIPLFIEEQSVAMASNCVDTMWFLPGALGVG